MIGETLTPWVGFFLKLMDLRLLNALPGVLFGVLPFVRSPLAAGEPG